MNAKKYAKKIIMTMAFAAALLAVPSAALADEQVNVTLPTFPVVLNGVTFEQNQLEYPLLVYKDITYVAMTYHDARLLGLETVWSQESGFAVKKADFIPEQLIAQQQYVPYISEKANNSSYKAVRPTFAINVNGNAIDNSKEEYPLLVFRDVTYFPLTWRFAVDEFGWNYTFDMQTGLNIAPVPTPTVPVKTDDGSTVLGNGTTVYVTGDVVNLREGAGTNYARAGQALEGDVLTIVGSGNDADGKLWYQIKMEDGAKWWIASWLVSNKKEDAGNVEVSTGVLTEVELQPAKQDARKTTFAIKNGEGNLRSVKAISETQMQMELDNVTVSSSLSASSGGFNLRIVSDGDKKATLTLNYGKGSYAAAVQEGDWLMMNCYTTTAGLAGKTIVLDPGHGGADSGAVGRTMPNVTDADIGYTVACRLQTLLEQSGAEVVFTRGDLEKHERVFMEDRIEMSNGLEPDIYISIHGNSTEGVTQATGAESYTYNGKCYTQQALAEDLARKIASGIGNATGEKSVTKTKNLYVLRMNDHPSVLVECGYLTNPHDEALLATDEYRQKLAEGIYAGVIEYFNQF